MLPVVDAHLDLAYLAQQGVDLRRPSADPDRFGVNLPSLRSGGVGLVFATIFTEWLDATADQSCPLWAYRGPADEDGAERAALDQLRIYTDFAAQRFVRIISSKSDLAEVGRDPVLDASRAETSSDQSPPLSLLILMEGGDPVRQPRDLEHWFDRGVRALGLTWARGSRYAGGNARPGPLTELGRELLNAMSRLGVILDVSHLSDQAFDESLERFDGPVMASHSNARALLQPSERHLRDDQALRIAERGGVIGLNLYGSFLASGRRATIADAVRHLEHWRALVGVEHIGIGSDLDGGFTPLDCPDGLGRPEELQGLFEALNRAAWTADEIRAVASGSWMSFLARALPA